jgi:hypothetical protein
MLTQCINFSHPWNLNDLKKENNVANKQSLHNRELSSITVIIQVKNSDIAESDGVTASQPENEDVLLNHPRYVHV